ncbi:MAG: hypothetical protein HY764_02545 [Candidatus Portnoybacteria bacterium]|nr:hypothetical protein [Candidatus Portnoybacteria bacterium]
MDEFMSLAMIFGAIILLVGLSLVERSINASTAKKRGWFGLIIFGIGVAGIWLLGVHENNLLALKEGRPLSFAKLPSDQRSILVGKIPDYNWVIIKDEGLDDKFAKIYKNAPPEIWEMEAGDRFIVLGAKREIFARPPNCSDEEGEKKEEEIWKQPERQHPENGVLPQELTPFPPPAKEHTF